MPRIVDAEQARAAAEAAARAHGRDLGRYRLESIDVDREGSSAGSWSVLFTSVPPTPGGHFLVIVDAETGEARLRPGA